MHRLYRPETSWTDSTVFHAAVLLLLLLAVVWAAPPPTPLPPHVTVMPLHLSAPVGAVPTTTADLL